MNPARELRRIQPLLGLKDWVIYLTGEACAEDAHADISPLYGQKRARIRLDPAFGKLSEADQRRILIHELLHCHLECIKDFVRDALSESDEALAFAVLAGVNQHVEYAVDAISTAMTPMLAPRPKETK